MNIMLLSFLYRGPLDSEAATNIKQVEHMGKLLF